MQLVQFLHKFRKREINLEDHFYPEVKMIEAGKWAKRSIDNMRLTRRACYQIAMKIQLVPFWNILLVMGKNIKQNTIISMSYYHNY